MRQTRLRSHPPGGWPDGDADRHSLLVVPTDRHREERIRQGQPADTVLTFPRLLDALIPTTIADRLPEAHQRMVLDHVVGELSRTKKLKALGGLTDQPGFRRALFAELSELSGTGTTPDDFEAALGHAFPKRRFKDADLALIYRTYRHLLTRQKWHDRAVDYQLVMPQFDGAFRRKFPDCLSIQVDGFARFAPTQLALLQKMQQLGLALQVNLPADGDDADRRAELFSVSTNTQTEVGAFCPHATTITTPLTERPAGLRQVAMHLFDPSVRPTNDSAGLHLIEAPGMVGEVKLVVRAVKTLLLNGARPDDIVVTTRDLSPYADLLIEFCTEYGIPFDIEGSTPLDRIPAVAALLKAAKLVDRDFPFPATGALLRNSFLQPEWPEFTTDLEIPLDTELCLRWLGEPRGRDAYLNAATKQANNLDEPLEDESAASAERKHRQQLAKRCLPFLTRFLAAWDALPKIATLAEFGHWLSEFATDLGFFRTATGRDAKGLQSFFAELASWTQREQQLHQKPPTLARDEFWSVAGAIAAANGLRRTESGPGRVRIVTADLAAGLTYQHLFLLGLSEGSFPNLALGPRLYDEQERQELQGVGLGLEVSEERRPAEMLLFQRLMAGAQISATLSYPAVDEQGQALLPATFLSDVKRLFTADAIPTTRRQMLIEGLDADLPMSPTEYRWRYAFGGGEPGPLSADLVEHLQVAQTMAQQRFTTQEFGPYDGMLRDVTVLRQVDERFGPTATFSATALENYVACPFKYYVGQALQLEALPEPGEEIEARMRGAAYHRAVARLHREQKQPSESTTAQLIQELEVAVAEYARRAGSAITKALWQLENDRLGRHSKKYGQHWSEFRSECDQAAPADLEVDFGPNKLNQALVIRRDNLEIRISGRIDRIDIVDHDDDSGFWIIDYKTGSSKNYTGPAIDRFEALQLPLYAWAAHEEIAPFRSRRPMGIAYWFPTSGPKIIKQWHAPADWQALRDRLEQALTLIVAHIRQGAFPLQPRDRDNCTSTCDFGHMCRIAQSRNIEKNWTLPLPTVEAATDD